MKEKIYKISCFIKDKEWLIALILNTVVMLFAFVFHTPVHETNDDVFFEDVLSGAYGGDRRAIVFVNWFLATFLKQLYMIFPKGNIYAIFSWILVFLAFWSITYVILKKAGKKMGLTISTVLLLVFYSQFYLILQFTRVGFLCGIAGYFLIFYNLEKEKCDITLGFGMVLVFLSFLVRQNAFLGASAFGFVMGIVIVLLQKDKKVLKQKVLKCIPIFGITFGVIAATFLLHEYIYSQNTEWKAYIEYNKNRADLQDFGWPSYEENKKFYKSVGISENDYKWYVTTNIADDQFLTDEVIQKVVDYKQKIHVDKKHKNLLELYQQYLKSNFVFWLSIILLLLSLGIFQKNKYWIMSVLAVLVYLATSYYYFDSGRVVPRVTMPTVFCLLCVILYSYDYKLLKVKIEKKRYWALVAVVSLIISYGTGKSWYSYLQSQHINPKSLLALCEDTGNVYVQDHMVHGRSYFYYDAYHRANPGDYKNQVLYGGWLARSPLYKNNNVMLGVTNVTESLIANDNFYFCTKDSGNLLGKYIQSHYDSDIGWSIYRQEDWFLIYQYTSNFSSAKKDSKYITEFKGMKRYDKAANTLCLYVDLKDTENKRYKGSGKLYLETENKITGRKHTYRVYEDKYQKIKEWGNCLKVIMPYDKIFYYDKKRQHYYGLDDYNYRIIIKDENGARITQCEEEP